MENLKPVLQAALKDAMRNKDAERRNLIRNLNSAIKQVEVDESKELSAEDVVAVLQKEAKRRRESISEYEQAGRDDLVEVEQYELGVIKEFLPRQLSEDEITAIVQEVIAQVGAESPKDMGKVMGPVMARVKGVADGKLVNKVVKEQLS
jgi:uncharacterized protein